MSLLKELGFVSNTMQYLKIKIKKKQKMKKCGLITMMSKQEQNG